jgi:hypothetical protein
MLPTVAGVTSLPSMLFHGACGRSSVVRRNKTKPANCHENKQSDSNCRERFRPGAATPIVRRVRVMTDPFWPPGEYYVDNVRLLEVGE